MYRITTTSWSRTLSGLALAVACALAQAAHVEVTGGQVAGGVSGRATAGGVPADIVGTPLNEVLGNGQVLGEGSGLQEAAVGDGSAALEWAQWVSAESGDEGRPASFLLTSSTVLSITSPGVPLSEALALADTTLLASLTIASDSEQAGTAVKVNLSGTASSLFTSNLGQAQDKAAYEVVLRDALAQDVVLAHYVGSGDGGEHAFDLSFTGRVGDEFTLFLRQTTETTLLDATLVGDGVRRLESSVLVQGQLTVSAVPEGQSLAMAFAGLAVIAARGAAAHRRRSGPL